MRCDNDCTFAGLTEKIDSILKIEIPQVLAEYPASTERNRLNTILHEAYYDRGILLAERCDGGDLHVAIHDFGRVIDRFKNRDLKPSYLSDAYERRTQLYEKIGWRTSAEEDRIRAKKLRNGDA